MVKRSTRPLKNRGRKAGRTLLQFLLVLIGVWAYAWYAIRIWDEDCNYQERNLDAELLISRTIEKRELGIETPWLPIHMQEYTALDWLLGLLPE